MSEFERFFSCDAVNVFNTSTVQLSIEDLHTHCYRILCLFYGAAVIFGVILGAMVGVCCSRRNKYRRKLDLHRQRKRRYKGRQQVQLMLFSRRLSFDDVPGSDDFTIRHSVVQSSDFDRDATMERGIQPSSLFQHGLLYTAGSKDNLLSPGPSTNKHSDNCTQVSTTVINKSSDNFTQITANITNKAPGECHHPAFNEIKTEQNTTRSENGTPMSSPVSKLKKDQLENDKLNFEQNRYDRAACGNSFSPHVLNERKTKTMQSTQVLKIRTDDHMNESRFHSVVEFIPNSPGIKIDGKIWKTKSNE